MGPVPRVSRASLTRSRYDNGTAVPEAALEFVMVPMASLLQMLGSTEEDGMMDDGVR